MRIRWYLLREISQTFCAVILVVLLISLSNKLVRHLGKAAVGDISPEILFQLILFQIPELLAFLLPVALFLAILLCFSRMFADNEIPIMLACGLSWSRLVSVSLILGVAIMLGSATLTCYLGPKLAQYREKLLNIDGPMLLMQTIAPGRFHSLSKDSLVFYVSDLNAERTQFKHIFVAEKPKEKGEKEGVSVLMAKSGKVVSAPETGATYIQLTEGRRYFGTPGERAYQILQFQSYQRLLEGAALQEGPSYHRTMSTLALFQDPTPRNIAELQWRFSIPLSALLLALLAVPLSQVPPRAGRFGRLFAAVMICILYYNLLTLSKRWIITQVLPPEIGVWWVHGLLGGLALLYLARTSGSWQQWVWTLKKPWRPTYE